MPHRTDRDTPILLWPFVATWWLLTAILELTGRILCALLGLVLMAAGVAITLSVIAAPVGIPLAAFGFLLVIRALF